MRKNKLYLILAIITSLTLFTTAAICNQCQGQAEEKTSEGEEASAEEKMEEEIAEEESIEEEATEEEEQSYQQEGQAEAPTIELQIYEGPTYLSGDDVCYYLIKAIVTGSPAPDIEFSKDDSNGALLPKKVQINLNDPSDTYTLTATATNSEDTATDSITLSWGCPIPNNPPEITEIKISPGTIFVGSVIDVEAVADDPDGDSLSYEWTADEGSFTDENAGDTEYTVPDDPGSYLITVQVSDGNGGTDEKTKSVPVSPPPQTEHSMEVPIDEVGFVLKDNFAASTTCTMAMVGDHESNNPYRGFVSFDISVLGDATISDATLTFTNPREWGSPYDHLVEAFWVRVVNWGDDELKLGDFDLPSKPLGEYSDPNNITINNQALKDALQLDINNNRDRFQIMIRHKGYPTNNNNNTDYVGYKIDDITLDVDYTGS